MDRLDVRAISVKVGWLVEHRSWEADFPVPIRAGRGDTSEMAVSSQREDELADHQIHGWRPACAVRRSEQRQALPDECWYLRDGVSDLSGNGINARDVEVHGAPIEPNGPAVLVRSCEQWCSP